MFCISEWMENKFYFCVSYAERVWQRRQERKRIVIQWNVCWLAFKCEIEYLGCHHHIILINHIDSKRYYANDIHRNAILFDEFLYHFQITMNYSNIIKRFCFNIFYKVTDQRQRHHTNCWYEKQTKKENNRNEIITKHHLIFHVNRNCVTLYNLISIVHLFFSAFISNSMALHFIYWCFSSKQNFHINKSNQHNHNALHRSRFIFRLGFNE